MERTDKRNQKTGNFKNSKEIREDPQNQIDLDRFVFFTETRGFCWTQANTIKYKHTSTGKLR